MRFTFNRNSDDMLVKLCSTSNWTESVPPNSDELFVVMIQTVFIICRPTRLWLGHCSGAWCRRRAFWAATTPRVVYLGQPSPPGLWYFTLAVFTFCELSSSQYWSNLRTVRLDSIQKKKKKRQDFTMAHTHTHRQAVTALQRSDTSMLQGCCI